MRSQNETAVGPQITFTTPSGQAQNAAKHIFILILGIYLAGWGYGFDLSCSRFLQHVFKVRYVFFRRNFRIRHDGNIAGFRGCDLLLPLRHESFVVLFHLFENAFDLL